MPTPPRAPTAPPMRISAPDIARSQPLTSSADESPFSSIDFAAKTAGIILYTAPLPTPEITNSRMNPTT